MTTSRKTPKSYANVGELERQFGPVSVGRLLKAFREGDELSQAEFARRLGISRANLCDIEQGRKQVSVGRAAKFAKVLGLPEAAVVQYALQEQLRTAKLKLKVAVRAA